MKMEAAERESPVEFRGVHNGPRADTLTLPQVVRAAQMRAERAAVTLNAWNGAPPSGLAIAEIQSVVTGLQSLLRQARSLADVQK